MQTQITAVECVRSDMEERYQIVFNQVASIDTPYQANLFCQIIYNQSIQTLTNVRQVICEKIPELNNPALGLAVALTGSDGRLEKANPTSPVELIIVAPESSLSPEALIAKGKIESLVRNEGSRLFFHWIEEKNLEKDTISVCANTGKSAPSRSLDAQFIGGNINVFVAYKAKLKRELGEKAKLVKNFETDLFKLALKTLEAEASPTIPSPIKGGSPKRHIKPLAVDIASGILRSDGKYLRGPKYGMMRTIQYAIDILIFRKISQMSEEEVRSIPPTIQQRIDWLQERQLIDLTFDECAQLKGCYAQAIFWYAALEQQACLQGASEEHVISIDVDPLTLSTTIHKTQELVRKMFPAKRKIVSHTPESPLKRARV